MSKMGSPTGTGNPPGKYSDSYLTPSEGMHEQFMDKASYQAHMDVGMNRTAKEASNQPKENRTFTLESQDNKANSI